MRTHPPAPLPISPVQQALLDLQRWAGNDAVSGLLSAAAPGSPMAVLAAQRQPTPPDDGGAPPGGAPPGGAPGGGAAPAQSDAGTPPAPASGPEITQGPIGDVIVHLPDWEFLPSRTLDKSVTRAIEKTTFLKLPIPELGVRIDVSGHADANAAFSGG